MTIYEKNEILKDNAKFTLVEKLYTTNNVKKHCFVIYQKFENNCVSVYGNYSNKSYALKIFNTQCEN